MKIRSAAAALILAILLNGTTALPHHSFAAEFDINKPFTLKGTITKFDFVNPHSWLYFDVKGTDGKVVNWGVELAPPNTLIRRGFTKNSVPVGSIVTVEGYQAKDGSSTGTATTVKLPDGTSLFAGSTAPGGPGTTGTGGQPQ
jgi:hypothetical protein